VDSSPLRQVVASGDLLAGVTVAAYLVRPVALMTAATVSAVAAGQRTSFANAAAVLAMAVGAICLLGWIGLLGFLANCCLGRC
jgi:MFS superfamily sulfate permease-like transporter